MSRRVSPVEVLALGLVAGVELIMASLALPLRDPDTLWHVLLGRYLWQTWQFVGPAPRADLPAEKDYVYNQWLPELAMAGVDQLWGLPGLAVLAHIGRVLLVVGLYVLCRREAGVAVSAGVAFVAALGCLNASAARPQLVGVILLVVTVAGWRAMARGDAAIGRARWLLVPVAWLWASSHGTWVVGPAIGLATAVGLWLDPATRSRTRSAVLLAAACAVTGVLTPVGPQLGQTFVAVREVAWFASEWQRPDPLSLAGLAVVTLTLLVLAGLRRRRRWSELLPLLVGLGFAATSVRGLAIGAVVLAPAAARALTRSAPPAVVTGERPAVAAPAIASLVLALALAPSLANRAVGMPDALRPQIAALRAGTVVFNSIGAGGWLMYAEPHVVPVVDSRLEVYGDSYLRRMVTAYQAGSGWPEIVADSRASAALLVDDAPLVAALRGAGWVERGRGDGYVLLGRPGS